MSLVGFKRFNKGEICSGGIRRNRPSVCRVNTPGGRRNQNPRNTDGGGFSRTCGLRQFLSVLGGSNQPDAGSGMPSF